MMDIVSISRDLRLISAIQFALEEIDHALNTEAENKEEIMRVNLIAMQTRLRFALDGE